MEGWQEAQQRALSFGGAAQLYDDARPSYPEQMIDDLADLAPGRRVVEVGAGTGKATKMLARRGLAVSCLEPDPAMAAILSQRCGHLANIAIDIQSFEEWEGAEDPYDGLVSAQAWHWTDPASRWERAADAVTPGGLIALFWNIVDEESGNTGIYDLLDAVYSEHGLSNEHNPASGRSEPDAWPIGEMRAHPAIEDVRVHTYRRRQGYTAEEFVAYLNTTSQHRTLPPQLRDRLTDGIIDVINHHEGGTMLVDWRTDLYRARHR